MRIAFFLLLVACDRPDRANPLADAVDSATGYQVLACLPPGYGIDLTFGASIEIDGFDDERIEFKYLGNDPVSSLHCALLPGMSPRANDDRVIHYTVTLDNQLEENKQSVLTLVYFPSTIEIGQRGTHKIVGSYRNGHMPVRTYVKSKNRVIFSFNVAPAAMNDDVTIAILPIPEGGHLNPTR